ncbi:MAG: MATE family efflux transporter [Eubacteriales bacterium]|nr:MATE family efflux transporter [Eubacteriales bacterium]
MEVRLDSDDIKKLVLNLALPSMMAQFVSVLYSIVDRMYIGNIQGIGEIALAGVGVCGPILTMIAAFSFLIGIGGGPLVSIQLGKKHEEKAEKILSDCFMMLLIIAVSVMAVSYLLKDNLLRWFGASDAVFPYADEYISIYLSGTIFALMSTGMNQFIICQGYSKTAMHSVMIGAVLNIILDPVFIFVLDMNVAGAALATVLSQLASCIFVLGFLSSKRSALRIHFGIPLKKNVKKVLKLGMSPFLIIAFDNVMLIALNSVITKYGAGGEGDMLLTCNTILQSFMLMITMPLGGITGGTQTILGYNYGAGRRDKIIKAQKYILMLAVAFCAVMFVIAQLGSGLFIRIFTSDPAYIEMTKRIIKIYTLAIIPLAIQYVIVDGFTGMGIYQYAFALSAWRKTIYFLGVFIIPAIFGIEQVFWAEVASDILGPIVSITLYFTLGVKLLRKI